MWGTGCFSRRIREREFCVRERRGDGDFPVKLVITSAWRSNLEKAAKWRVGRGAQGKSCSSSRHVRVTKQNREKLRRGEETPVALRGRVRLGEGGNHWHSRKAERTTHFPAQFSREASVLLPEAPSAALTLRSESGAGGADVVAHSLDPLPVRGRVRAQYPLVQGRRGSKRVSASEQAEKQPKLFLAPPQAEIGALPSLPHPRGKMGTGRGL